MFHLHDSKNFLQKASLKKLWNAGQVESSYQQSRMLGVPNMAGMPMTISFEPTTACNLRCPECPSGLRSFTRPRGMLQEDLFRKVMDEVGDDLLYLYLYFQGEPYLNPNFLDLVSYAHKKKVYSVTSTNAHFLDDENARRTVESGLDRLIISLDGTTQETYENYRIEGELDKVIEGTKNLIAWKKKLKSKTPHTIFQFLVVKPNEHQIPEVYRLAKELGVDEVKLKTAQIYDYENGNELIPSIDKYSRYRKLHNGKYELKNELENGCWKMWHSCVVTWDGKVVPCCFDKDANHKLGDLSTTGFKEIWNSEGYNSFRQHLLTARKEVDICTNCTEGTKVWA